MYKEYKMKQIEFCEVCGLKLKKDNKVVKYNPYTGEPIISESAICPSNKYGHTGHTVPGLYGGMEYSDTS